jgi:hypothetical protein
MPNQEYNEFFRAKSILIVAKPSYNTIIVVVRQSRRVLLLFPSYYSINILPALLNNHYSCAGGVIDKKNVKYRAPNNKYLFPTRISFDRPCKILKFLSGLGTSNHSLTKNHDFKSTNSKYDNGTIYDIQE